eukprot:g32826.t1
MGPHHAGLLPKEKLEDLKLHTAPLDKVAYQNKSTRRFGSITSMRSSERWPRQIIPMAARKRHRGVSVRLCELESTAHPWRKLCIGPLSPLCTGPLSPLCTGPLPPLRTGPLPPLSTGLLSPLCIGPLHPFRTGTLPPTPHCAPDPLHTGPLSQLRIAPLPPLRIVPRPAPHCAPAPLRTGPLSQLHTVPLPCSALGPCPAPHWAPAATIYFQVRTVEGNLQAAFMCHLMLETEFAHGTERGHTTNVSLPLIQEAWVQSCAITCLNRSSGKYKSRVHLGLAKVAIKSPDNRLWITVMNCLPLFPCYVPPWVPLETEQAVSINTLEAFRE